jgi:hypothetical protein
MIRLISTFALTSAQRIGAWLIAWLVGWLVGWLVVDWPCI